MNKNSHTEIITQQEQPASTKDLARNLSNRVWPTAPNEIHRSNYGLIGPQESILGKANIETNQLSAQPIKEEPKTQETSRAPVAKSPAGTEPLRESIGDVQRSIEQRQLLSSAPECRAGTPIQASVKNAIDATRVACERTTSTRAVETKDDFMESRHGGYGGPPPLSARSAETGGAPTASAERTGDRTQFLRSAIPDVGAERAPAYANGATPASRPSVLDRGVSQGDAHAAIASEAGPTRSVWSNPPPASKSPGIESGGTQGRVTSSDAARSAANESAIIPRTISEQPGSKDVSRALWNTQVPIREPVTPRTSDLSKTLLAELANLRMPSEHFAATRNSELYAGRNASDPLATVRQDYNQMRTYQPPTNSHLPDGRSTTNHPHLSDGKGLAEPVNRPDARMFTEPNNRTGEKDATNTPHKPYGNEATNFTHKPDGKDAASSIHKPNDKDLTNTTTNTRTEGIDKPSGRPVAGSGRVESAGQMTDGRIGIRVDFDGGRTSDYAGTPRSSDRGIGGGSGGGSGSSGGGRTGDVAVFVPGVLPGTKNGTRQEIGSATAGIIGKTSSTISPTSKVGDSKSEGPQTVVLSTREAKNKNTVVSTALANAIEPFGLMGALKVAAQRIFKADSLRAKVPGNPNLPGPRTEQIPMRGDNASFGASRSAAPAIASDTRKPLQAGPGQFSPRRTGESDIEKTVRIESKLPVTNHTYVLPEPMVLPNYSTKQTETYAEDYTLVRADSSLENESDKVGDDTVASPAPIHRGMFAESQQTAYYYVAKQGDTVDSVAREVLKDAAAGPLLFQMNTQIVAAIFVNGRTELFFKAGSVVYLPTPYQIVQHKAVAV